MRDILFRGKSVKTGQWVYGYYYQHEPPLICFEEDKSVAEKPKHYILQTAFADWGMQRQVDVVEVEPDSIGQWTGVEDRSKNKIFEGDNVCVICKEFGKVYKGVVQFGNGCFGVYYNDGYKNKFHPFNETSGRVLDMGATIDYTFNFQIVDD